MEWMIVKVAGAIIAIGGALTYISKGVVWMYRTVRRVNGFLDDWAEIQADIKALKADVEAIKHEVFPNSGLSLRDSVNRTEAMVQEHIANSSNETKKD